MSSGGFLLSTVNRQPSTERQPSTVYLTFDDGPDPDFTPQVLDVLAAAEACATFFMIGAQARRHASLARRVANAGHAIGNHTLSHRHPWLMTPAAARREVSEGAEALSDAIGVAPRVFRPPHGRKRACMTDEAQRLNQRVVMWDLSAVDWGPFGTPEGIGQRLARIESGDIVLMHDGRNRHNRPDHLLKVLPAALRRLRECGMQFAQV
jgi:peptidoglycan-N-acetylglucosamine deacetylase